MEVDTGPRSQSESNTNERHVRITQQGKMRVWIKHSLAFLEKDEGELSIVLHTLPNLPKAQPDTDATTSKPQPPITQQSASLSTAVVPRLISVVEIMKREYIKLLETKKSSRMIGLHQYNEIGTLEELGVAISSPDEKQEDKDTEAKRSLEIIQALSGKNHLRQTQTPFMRVTLSKSERPDLLAKGATYQPPTVRKLSKAAKARIKKRAKASQVKDMPMEDTTAVA